MRVSLQNKKRKLTPRTITRKITALFSPRIEGNPQKRYPDAYYKHVYVSKPMFNGIELIARFEKISKKQAAHLLLEAGFKYYVGEKIRKDIEARTAAKKLNQKIQVSKFIMELEKYCREQGIDISKAVEFLQT